MDLKMSLSTTKSGMVQGEDVTNKEVRYEVRILFRDKRLKLRYFKKLQDANNCHTYWQSRNGLGVRNVRTLRVPNKVPLDVEMLRA